MCEAMPKVDLQFLLCSTGMLHSPANSAAMKAGHPVFCMDGGKMLEMFHSGAVTENQKEMAIRHRNVGANIFGMGARHCRVTSRFGCDFTCTVEGRIRKPQSPPPTMCLPYVMQNVAKVQYRSRGCCAFGIPPANTMWPRPGRRATGSRGLT